MRSMPARRAKQACWENTAAPWRIREEFGAAVLFDLQGAGGSPPRPPQALHAQLGKKKKQIFPGFY